MSGLEMTSMITTGFGSSLSYGELSLVDAHFGTKAIDVDPVAYLLDSDYRNRTTEPDNYFDVNLENPVYSAGLGVSGTIEISREEGIDFINRSRNTIISLKKEWFDD